MENKPIAPEVNETGLSLQLNTLLTCNKDWRTSYAKSIIDEVVDGNADAQQVLVTAKKGIEIFTLIEKNVKSHVASKQIQKGGISIFGTTIVEKKDPDKYDFSVCGDTYYDALCEKEEKIKAAKKERETFLKSIKKPLTETDGDYAGEIINPPAITYGAQNVSVTLDK